MAAVEQRENKTTGPTWRVYWRQNGRRQGENFTSPDEAERFKQLVDGSGNQWPHGWQRGYGFTGAPKAGAGTSFRDWAEQAVDQRSRANARSKADYRRDLNNHIYPYLGSLPVDGITATHVTTWLDALVDAGFADKTIANLHGLASSIIADAMTHRPPLCDHNPFASKLGARADVRVEEMVFLTPAEFEAVYRHVPRFYQPLTLMLWGTGERYGEATAQRVRDLELDGRKTSTVVRAWKRDPGGTYTLGEPKTPRSRRTVPLSPKLADALRQQIHGKRPDDLVFPAREGGQLLNSTFHDSAWALAVRRARTCDRHYGEQYKAWRTDKHRLQTQRDTRRRVRFAARPCGCPGTISKEPRVHDLRHSHASLLIAAGLPLPVISRRLGHKSIQVTVDRYGHLLPELDDAVSAAIDRGLAWLD